MTLQPYNAKRNPKKTGEPAASKKLKPGKGSLIFVVQKHAASHLHYDLRLELDGVLKSWAVPKGPSMDPADKRLAIEVEDHPLEYASFEGTIPPGHYGAGEVEIWDSGTYSVPAANKREEENLIRSKLAKGELTFNLHGKKLKGEFALVRLKSAEKKNQWLLIKKSQN
jgi:bifunctional non-homologous end joining protein LigD